MSAGRRGALQRPPLWARWVITIAAFAVAIAVVAAIARGGGSPGTAQDEAEATREANRVGRIAIGEDQAPHTARLASGLAPPAGLRAAITRDVHGRITHGELTGPLQSVRCAAAGSGRRQAYRCTVRSAGLSYPFDAVYSKSTRTLSWCKVDPPPRRGEPLEVPLSPRCRA